MGGTENGKKTGRLFPAILIWILLGAFILIAAEATYAWISGNNAARANRENLELYMPVNVLISSDTNLSNGMTLEVAELEDYGFASTAGITVNSVLYPSSFNGTTFYYATVVDEDGRAVTPDDETVPKYMLVPNGRLNLFRVHRDFFVVTTTESIVTLYISGIDILQGTSNTSQLYKAVRVSVTYGDETVVYCLDGQSVPPVRDGSTTLAADIAVENDEIDESDDDTTIHIPLPAASEALGLNYATVRQFSVNIWIEGENPYAVVDYAGTGFRVNVHLDVVED